MITENDKKYILDNYKNKTYEVIANELGINKGSVRYVVDKYAGGKRFPLINKDAEKFIRDNYITMTYTDIGKHIGLDGKQVEGWIRNHIDNRIKKRREFNSSFFHEIDTSDKAYFLGFIFADGYITRSERNYEFGIELQSCDKYILEYLNNLIGGVHNIHHNHKKIIIANNKSESISDTDVLRVYSKEMVNDLLSHGINFNKTLSKEIPIVRDEYFFDFLRGYIDGDGCIHKMQDGIVGVHITCANKEPLDYINSKVNELLGFTTSIYHEADRKYRIYWFNQKKVDLLLKAIYYSSNVTKLERKYKKYLDLKGLAA